MVKKNRGKTYFLFEKENKIQGYTGGLGLEIIQEPFPDNGTRKCLLEFLNPYINNPQAHGITVIAFHPEVFRVPYFHEEWMCKSLLASSPNDNKKKDSSGSEVF